MLMPKPLLWSKPSAVMRYAVAVISVILTLLLARMLEHYWQTTPFVSLFFCAIMFSAWFGGLRAGLLAIGLSVLVFDYYFLQPLHSFLPNLNELPRLILFAISGLIVGLLSAAQRSATESLREARDDLAAKVDELRRTNDALQEEITERNRAQQALHKVQADLAHMTRLTTMGELTASIAHEVNQPLTAVLNNANACLDLLMHGAPNLGEVREALTEIIDDADRASAVIMRVRQLAKGAPIEKSLLNLNDIVNDVLTLARYESAARQVAIRTELSEGLPLVLADQVQLQQVLLNLVVNGMDAMSAVEASRRLLIICGRRETRNSTSEALISVQDAGIGFKSEEVDRLFEAFYTTKPQGIGMGLAISRSIIEDHGGHLWAEQNQRSGATFSFSLPAAEIAKS
ncbi:MAG: histidine kinase [Verrucomicrobiales bacterium]|nr:histidine kinase [Verrucomicrobiales bacterium]